MSFHKVFVAFTQTTIHTTTPTCPIALIACLLSLAPLYYTTCIDTMRVFSLPRRYVCCLGIIPHIRCVLRVRVTSASSLAKSLALATTTGGSLAAPRRSDQHVSIHNSTAFQYVHPTPHIPHRRSSHSTNRRRRATHELLTQRHRHQRRRATHELLTRRHRHQRRRQTSLQTPTRAPHPHRTVSLHTQRH